jgi:hypothetical protein
MPLEYRWREREWTAGLLGVASRTRPRARKQGSTRFASFRLNLVENLGQSSRATSSPRSAGWASPSVLHGRRAAAQGRPGRPRPLRLDLRCEHVRTQGEACGRDRPARPALLTNGRAMTAEVLALCKDLGVHLGMSLPGFTTLPDHTAAGRDTSGFSLVPARGEVGVRTHVGITSPAATLDELYQAYGQALLRRRGRGAAQTASCRRPRAACTPESCMLVHDVVRRCSDRRGGCATAGARQTWAPSCRGALQRRPRTRT